MAEFKNTYYGKVTQYKAIKDGRPLKIEKIEIDGCKEMWQVVDFGFKVFEAKTGLEVKQYLGKKPELVGAFEIYHTPVGNAITKQVYGTKMF